MCASCIPKSVDLFRQHFTWLYELKGQALLDMVKLCDMAVYQVVLHYSTEQENLPKLKHFFLLFSNCTCSEM